MNLHGSLLIWIQIVLLNPVFAAAQVWWEETDTTYNYHLSAHQILVVIGDDFDYQETMIIKQHWLKWGARVDIAGTDAKMTGHLWNKTEKGWDNSEQRTIETDLLLTKVDLSNYHALFLPGGKGPENLLKKDSLHVVELIQRANEKGLILAAICHGPKLLAAAGVVNGHKVTAHPEVEVDIQRAGGEFVTEICVVDGNVITGNWPYFETMAKQVAERLLDRSWREKTE